MRGSSRLWNLGALLPLLGLLPGCSGGQAPTARPAAAASPPPFSFRDVAAEAGLDFQWGHQGKTPLTNLETFGCGCAFLDFDRDGRLDIFLVGEPRCGLYRNRGDGRFEDISASAGLSHVEGLWKGVAVGDMDADGWSDLVVTGYHRTVALKNVAGRELRDVTAQSGIRNDGWGASAGFSDLDNDGDLDLYVCNYVIFGPKEQQLCELAPGVRSGCPPSVYRAERGRLFRNDGRGRFTDITQASGVLETDGKSLVVGFCDYDADGRTDFYVGNDGTPADLFQNRGGLRFRNAGLTGGVALNRQGNALAAMGIDWGDINRDGLMDAGVTAFSNESFALFRQEAAVFVEDSASAETADATYKPLGFGMRMADFDNDGWLDLVYACGHVYDTTDKIDPLTSYRQPLMFFRNTGGWRFAQVAPPPGADWARAIVGRGLAAGDYDADGRQDLLVVDYEGRPQLLHNETATQNRWLEVTAAGPAGNPLGYGCRVTVTVDGQDRVFQLSPVSSYLSSSQPAVHVGLGAAERVERVRVRWPGGREAAVDAPPVNSRVTVRYEDSQPGS